MTRPSRAAFRGEVLAAAYLIDPTTVGEDEARLRALARWTPGTRLLAWPDGRWLLVLGTPETLLAERAPGLPLVGGHDGLATPGEPVTAGVVRLPRDDGGNTVAFDDLAAVDVAAWLVAGAFTAVELGPVEGDRQVDVPDPLPPDSGPDLRTLAGVGPPTAGASELVGPPRRASRFTVVLAGLGAVLVLIAAVAAIVAVASRGGGAPRADPPVRPTAASTPTPTGAVVLPPPTTDPTSEVVTSFSGLDAVGVEPPPKPSDYAALWTPIGVVLLVGIISALSRRRRVSAPAAPARTAQQAAARRQRRSWRDAVVRAVLGSPAGGLIGRRHARYLRELAENLERGRWDALAGAIALGGTGGVLSLRLPRARSSLSPAQAGGRGGAVDYGPSVADHLRELYRQAARKLEREGDIEKAAFVLAVLLHDPGAAVALLERAGNPALAAHVAEVRGLDPALAVRLWWQAGDRERAVRVARNRGAFAAAVVRLEQVDPSLAHELRAAWVSDARAAGDAVTAVDAAWPVAELRRHALPDLQAGLEAGGPAAGHLLARFLSGGWNLHPLDRVAVDLLSAPTAVEASLRTGFLTALADQPAADATLDRRLCSAAALVTIRDERALAGVPARGAKTSVAALRRRADPLLVADLPPWQPVAVDPGTPTLDLAGPPGTTTIRDAVVLGDGSTLVALGELGLRWLTVTGSVRARWPLPVDRVVLADHGRTALLLRQAGRQSELHRLDLRTRRLVYWTTLQAGTIADSFDGSVLVTADEDGIAVLDTLSDRPRVTWRELSVTQPVFALSRTPERLTAVTLAPSPPGAWRSTSTDPRPFELFDWELPSMILRLRRPFVPHRELRAVFVTPGDAVQFGRTGLSAEGLTHLRGWSTPRFVPLPSTHRVLATADALTTIGAGGPDGFVATVTVGEQPPVTVRGTGSVIDVGVHRHGRLLTVHDGSGGRVVGLDLDRGEVVARVRTDL